MKGRAEGKNLGSIDIGMRTWSPEERIQPGSRNKMYNDETKCIMTKQNV